MNKKKLSREELTAPWQSKVVEVPVPEKGEGAVMFVRSISAFERKGLEAMSSRYNQSKRYEDITDFNYLLLAMTISDEDGKRFFQDDELELIRKFPATVVDRLFTAAAELNGLNDKKKSEQAEKNLPSAPNGASPSA